MVRNMNFNDPDKPNGEELSIDEDDQHNNAASGQDDVTMMSANIHENSEIETHDEPDEADPAEYSLLDKQLDDLNSVLDVLEQKNDYIQSQLKVLLENSREIRQNLVKEKETGSSDLETD